MAEGGFLERFLGGGEGEETESEVGAPSSDPIAATVALDGARFDPELSRKAGEYLDEQRRLVKIQTEHLHEQRAVQLSHLKLRRFTDRLKAGTQLFIIMVASVIGLGVLVMLYDAFASRTVVVDAFAAPSALASRGVTGDVVAAGVLDTLQKLQAATRGTTKALSAKGAWSSDIKIEVPETGVSIGEINRLLHERFGHDLHIDGDLIQTDTGGLALTVRGDEVPAKTFQGAMGELDKLTTQAAEYVYGQSQPLEYADYLQDADRMADAVAFTRAAYAHATTNAQRVVLGKYLADAYAGVNEPAKAVEQYRVAMALQPGRPPFWWKTWSDLLSQLPFTSGEEAAWQESQAFLRAAAAAPKRERPELYTFASAAGFVWDLPLQLAADVADASRGAGGGNASSFLDGPQIADIYALMHNPAQEANAISQSDPEDYYTKAEAPLLQGYSALDRGDAAAAIAPLEAFDKARQADPNLQNLYIDDLCFLGLAYGLAGRSADAQAVFQRAGPWSRCYAFHGDVLARAGDGAGAERVWAEGLKLAPDLPTIYLHRGLFELEHGDLKVAEVDLSAASNKAPHYADPLKAWGDLLAREGRWKDALAKYEAALKYAPAWAELHQARDAEARKV